MKKTVLLAISLFAFNLYSYATYTFSAVAPSGQTLYYQIYNSSAYVTYPGSDNISPYSGYPEPIGVLIIPDSVAYNGIMYPVKLIGNYAFSRCENLTSVIIPNTVTSIGISAFYACYGLTSINIPDSVTQISVNAFAYCINLSTIEIPNSVTYIREYAFIGCSNLTYVSIGSGVTSIGDNAFRNCSNITRIRLWSTQAPTLLGGNVFHGVPNNIEVLIPCGSLMSYIISSFASFFNGFTEGYVLSATSSDITKGQVDILTAPSCQNGFSALMYATAAPNCIFVGWSDANIGNPRVLTLTEDKSVVGYFVSNTVHSSDTIFINNYIHDTTIVNNWIYDTTYLWHHDTTYIYNYIHDTTIIDNWIFDTIYMWQYDTTYINNVIHDTTIVDNWIYDTTYIWQYDTTYINNYIHDTTIVDNWIFDTTFVDNWIHDTTYLWHYDTTIINNYIHDTTTVTLFDTIIITQYDTLMVTLIDTVTVTEQLTYHTLHIMSANNSQGLAAGNGTFPDGTNVEIAAIPIEGNRFVQWNDGSTDNPRTITVSSNMSFAASFEPADVAINSVEGSEYFITTSHNMISVIGATGERIRLFDTLGRQLTVSNNAADIQTFAVPATGAYFIQIGNRPARKVVVVR